MALPASNASPRAQFTCLSPINLTIGLGPFLDVQCPANAV